jgi:hypothetical protein
MLRYSISSSMAAAQFRRPMCMAVTAPVSERDYFSYSLMHMSSKRGFPVVIACEANYTLAAKCRSIDQ